ncbi:MAG: hypothetical protein WBX00_26430 [Isosphaeraceae bacterium]
MADTEERIRAALDLGESAPAAAKLNVELDKLIADLKHVGEEFGRGAIGPKEFSEQSGKLKEEIHSLEGVMVSIGGKAPVAGAGLDKLVSALFKLERGTSMLISDKGLPRAAGLIESVLAFAGGPAGIGVAMTLVLNTIENVTPKLKTAWDTMWNGLTPGGAQAVAAAKDRFKELTLELQTYTDATNKFVAAQRAKNEQVEREVALIKARKEQADKAQKDALAGIAAAHPVAPGQIDTAAETEQKERGKRFGEAMSREDKERMDKEVASYLEMKDTELGKFKDEERKLQSRAERAREAGDPSQVEEMRQRIITNQKAQAERRLRAETTAAQYRGQAEQGTLSLDDYRALSGMTGPATRGVMEGVEHARDPSRPGPETYDEYRARVDKTKNEIQARIRADRRERGLNEAGPKADLQPASKNLPSTLVAPEDMPRPTIGAIGAPPPPSREVEQSPKRTPAVRSEAMKRIRQLEHQLHQATRQMHQATRMHSTNLDQQAHVQGMIQTLTTELNELMAKVKQIDATNRGMHRQRQRTGQFLGDR